MKVLFIVQAIDYIDPLGLMTISAVAKKNGHATHLGIISRENIPDKINKLKPDIVAYSASTGEHKYYVDINKKIKDAYKDIFTIMGGAHTTFNPEIIKGSTLDAICIGEGEGGFAELLNVLGSGGDINKIQNIITRNGNDNGLRRLDENIDNIPFPDRDLFYKTTEMGRFPLKSFMASRGCPYFCTYCFNHAFRAIYKDKGKVVRRHSVDYVISQVKEVKDRYPLGFVKFYDDIFTYRVDPWLEEFAEKYKRYINLPFLCLTRADLLTEEMAKILKSAGCFSISMSIEAGNPVFRNQLLKRNMGNEQIIDAFNICHKLGIKTFSNNILGLPYATIENELETLDLNIKSKVSFAEFPIFHPYPKTELGNYCVEKGIYNHDYSDLHMSYMNKSPLSCFTEKEKNIQRNISRLGGLVVFMPFLRNIVVKYLIYLRYNKFYFLCYYLTKSYLVKTAVYPFKIGFKDLVRLFMKSINLESFKLSDEHFQKVEK